MIGHTAFLVTARRMAPGERPPLKKRRPAPGAYGPDYTGPRPPGVPEELAEDVRRLSRPVRPLRNRDQHRLGCAFLGSGTRVGSQATGGDTDADIGRSFRRGPESRGDGEPGALPRGRGRRPAAPALRRPGRLPRPRAAARRHPALARRGHLPERAPRPDPARGPRPDHEAQGGGRPAGPAAGRLRHLPRPATTTTRSTCSPAAASCGSTSARRVDLDDLRRGQEVMLNEALNVVAAFDFEEVGEVVMFKELLADGERALVIANADEERVVRLAEPLRDEHAPRRRLAAARLPRRLRLREGAEVRGRGAGPRGGPRHRLRVDRRPHRPDRADPRRRRAALPAPRAVQGAPAQAAQGRAALRPARLRQDADRQGGRQLAGQEGRGEDRAGGEVLLPQHQGPRAAQQVRRRDRAAHPAGVPAGPGEGQRGHAGHRVLRRDGLAVPHPRLRRLLRRREHHRPAAAQRDRRRRAARERPGHRRLQPRGHDRPGDPAARPARREDQDRASRRRVGARHLQQVPHRRRCRCTPTTSPSSAATATPASPG